MFSFKLMLLDFFFLSLLKEKNRRMNKAKCFPFSIWRGDRKTGETLGRGDTKYKVKSSRASSFRGAGGGHVPRNQTRAV